ncbi:hypothetical protein [Haloferax sp. Q22]|uniref:hypothetical protein n=1 Tax=Haloferax sp. (strain Q22) TaxID=1526048 RepID=UPI000737BF8F|nr:hypothetical protein [Haloferax sp. Q22]
MTRKSKRELERAVEALGDDSDTEPSAIVAFELEDGTYVDEDGDPIDRPGEVVFTLPDDVWSRWTDPPVSVQNL